MKCILFFGLLVCFTTLMLPSPGEASRYYIWTDAQGTKHITEEPPPKSVKQVDRVNYTKKAPQASITTPDGRSRETRVRIIDNQVLVPVTLGHGPKKIRVTLLLDTGASVSVLHEKAVQQLALKKMSKKKIHVAGGGIIEAGVLQLDFMAVGPIRQEEMTTRVIKHQGRPVPFDGLLGMDFLKGLDYRLDFERELLVWGPP